jgi:hypothetical protein
MTVGGISGQKAASGRPMGRPMPKRCNSLLLGAGNRMRVKVKNQHRIKPASFRLASLAKPDTSQNFTKYLDEACF